MNLRVVGASLALLLTGGVPLQLTASEGNAFREMLDRYEAIRLALLEDSLAGVDESARAISQRADELAAEFDAGEAGVTAAHSAECLALLPEISAAAARLAESGSLDEAREALFELSKPLGRYRKLAGIEGSMVVYCPMAKKAWIQPHGEIGNPYMGSEMPACGNVIAD